MVPKLLAIAKKRTDTRIYVRGDKNINYGRVLEVMDLSGAGFQKLLLFLSNTKIRMLNDKKLILLNHFSLDNDFINYFKLTFYVERTN